MDVKRFIEILGADFYTGIPDSQLKEFCNYLMNKYGINPKHHVIAANEGNCAALATGYHLATGKVPVLYMQNSGIGNIINPVASLLSNKVYAIPCILIIGWRGEPGVHDEPQHIFQGEITLRLLEDMDIRTFVISKSTTEEEIRSIITGAKETFKAGAKIAFVVRKDAFTYDEKIEYKNANSLYREEIIQHIVKVSEKDPIISTTGKASRELFETRVANKQSHKYDFLTVGGMGHSSSIALGVAANKPNQKIWCVDGDGAVLMHMGAIALIGANSPKNLVHIVVNNSAHETVGGMPTVAGDINLTAIATSCGYPYAVSVDSFEDLDRALEKAKNSEDLFMIEVKSAIGARNDLGRPTTTAVENKEKFMEYLKSI